ncbi:hypothetical protein Micbo1qcDRAFT_164928 [Microdochium bolleyi]|uniref:Uncharacterized protein n=1 Tax=Microdochium bolleyi TaxID=196109 RepID=A0A136IXP0_9PEZI|nr:hypothetical protein Micbo1qcDRAFT_164928 [Microdochium bolleyi]
MFWLSSLSFKLSLKMLGTSLGAPYDGGTVVRLILVTARQLRKQLSLEAWSDKVYLGFVHVRAHCVVLLLAEAILGCK